MAKIQRVDHHPSFKILEKHADERGEQKDCAVKAVALLCGVTYHDAFAALEAAGRQAGRGTPMAMTMKACAALGTPIMQINASDFRRVINAYPGVHFNLKNITTHHPRRFGSVWNQAPDCLMRSKAHILARVDNQVLDWSVNTALRVLEIYVRTSDYDNWKQFIAECKTIAADKGTDYDYHY